MKPIRLFEAVLIMMLALSVASSHAQAADPSDVPEPGEQEFNNGAGGSAGNEDSDALDEAAKMGVPSYAGTGCPQGTMTSTLSSDAKTLAIIFDNFAVRAGNGLGVRAQMNCQMRVPIVVPPGYKIEATRIDYRGFANAPDAKTRAVLQSRYDFLGSGERKKRKPHAGGFNNGGKNDRPGNGGDNGCQKPGNRGRLNNEKFVVRAMGGGNGGRGEKGDDRCRPNEPDSQRERFDQRNRQIAQKMLRRTVFKGPYSDSYLVSARVPAGGQSECGEDVTLVITNIATAVSQSGAETLMTVDTIDSATETVKYHLRWKRCN